MARRFLDDVRANIQSLLPDNITGEISPADMRTLLTDITDSTIQDECLITGDVGATFALTGTFQPINTGYNQTIGGDGVWLKPDQANGGIRLNVQAGWTYSVVGICSAQVAQNESVEFCILRDGVPSFFKPTVAGAGITRPVSVQMVDEILTSVSNELIQIGVRAIDGSASMDIVDIVLEVAIQPTNNP